MGVVAIGKGFEDLEVYQEARRFRQRVYKLSRLLPNDEKYNLIFANETGFAFGNQQYC